MKSISLSAAVTLTERSERTLWRWIAEGTVTRAADSAAGKTMIEFDSIKPHLRMKIEPDDFDLIESADTSGGAAEQNELALLILANGKSEKAVYWLEQAAKQGDADAMHWLGRCYLEGNGIAKNLSMGIMWLSKAAAYGHLISMRQIESLCAPVPIAQNTHSAESQV